MASDFYETHFLKYRNQTVNIDPSPFLSTLTRHLPKGARVLDIGCGSGRDLLWLKEQGYQPTGFERSSGLAEMAGQHSQCFVIQGDFTVFDFSILHFDAILLIGALVHLQGSELAPNLDRISKAVRQDGLIYLTLKEGSGCSQAEDGRIFTLWKPEDLEQTFPAIGLEILDFSRNRSAVNQQDVWLGYLLKKTGRRRNVRQA
jgi:SAM-dependent methyltransferase